MTKSKQASNSDIIQISPDKSSSFIHPTSKYLSLDVPLTRAGIFLYEDSNYPGGIRRDYRPVEEVLDEASLRSISGGGLPLVRLHPSVGVVTPKTLSDLIWLVISPIKLATQQWSLPRREKKAI